MSLSLKTPEGESPAAVGRKLIDIKVSRLFEVESFFSEILPFVRSLRNRWLQAGAAVVIGGASMLAILAYDKNKAQAKEPHFPDPLPKSVKVTGIIPSQQKQVTDNYEVLLTKPNAAGTELVEAVKLPAESLKPVSQAKTIIAKLKADPDNGNLYLDQIGAAFFTVRDLAIPDTNPSGVVFVGNDNNNQCQIKWTLNEGASIQQRTDSRGPCLKVSAPSDSNVLISLGDRLAEEYPRWLLKLDMTTGNLIDLNICTGCAANGLSGQLDAVSAGIYADYITADPHFGYAMKLIGSTGIISRTELRPEIGYVQGEPKSYNYQGFHYVAVFNNFAYSGSIPVGITYKDRYQQNGTNFTFLDSIADKTFTSLYPQNAVGFGLGLVVPDVLNNQLYKATGMHKFNDQTGNDTLTAFFEVAETNSLLANDGDWINQTGDDWIRVNSGDIITKGNNRLLLGGLARYIWVYDAPNNTMRLQFSNGKMVAKDLASLSPWNGMNLLFAGDAYLPFVTNGSTINKPQSK